MHPSPSPRGDPARDEAEVVLIADAARPPRPPRPVARWLVKIQHERHGVPQPLEQLAQDQGGEVDSDPLARPHREEDDSAKSRDMDQGVRGIDEEDECSTPLLRRSAHRLGRRSSASCPSAAAAETDMPPPPLPHPLQQHPDYYEPAPTDAPSSSSCRYSYGDFSSASSTASSSTSHSGFSSHSASSFTSVSSTQTFSAAASGWPVTASSSSSSTSPSRQGKTPQGGVTVPLQSLAAAVERAEGDEAASDGGTPVPEAQVEVLDLPHPHGATCGADESSSPAREDKPLPPCPSAGEPLSLCAPPTLRHVEPQPASTDVAHPALPVLPSSSTVAAARVPSPSTASSATGADDAPTTTTAPSDEPEPDADTLRPPENFAMVSPKLYRSSFPRDKHFPFLRSLGLKSVMVLVQEPYPEENVEFLKNEGIQLFQFGIPGNKEPFVSIPEDKIVGALSTILDARNHPMLIHCNKGKHRTGCVVGCLRRLQMWSLVSVFDEYRRYSHPKSRAMDLQCIEAFGGLPKVWDTVDREHLPQWATLDPPPLSPRPPPALAVASDDDDTASACSVDEP
ncbi:hypothetical protein JCM8208_001511 [Rhodotorula glutinis]